MSSPSVSVIVTTYDWPEALGEVLRGLQRQHTPPHEVLVADDGSDARTADLIAQWRERLPFPLLHVWQEHQGFRAARGRNRASARASGDYLVFLDGDSVPLPDFIAGHQRLAQARRFVAGQRILLSPAATQAWLQNQERLSEVSRWGSWFSARLTGRVNRLLPLLRLPDMAWRDRGSTRWEGVKTCNLGVWRSDFLAVNGFDEAFMGWGHEDADLAVRLLRHGVLRKGGRFAVPVLHLWHAPAPRAREGDNRAMLDATLAGQRPIRAGLGVSQHLAAVA
ncbi:MAG: glycosyltransferase family 2 protein [Pseudomonadota bacterium]